MMQWQQVEASDKFQGADENLQNTIKQTFYDRHIAPEATKRGLDLESVKTSFFTKTSNANAIDNIKTVDEVEGGQDILNESQEWLSKIITPEKQAEWEEKGSIGVMESFNRALKRENVPIVGNLYSLPESGKVLGIIDAVQNGKEISVKDKEFMSDYINDMAEVEARGVTLGGNIVKGVVEMPSFIIDFVNSGVLGGLGKTATKKAVGGLLKRGVTEATKLATRGAVRTTLMPQRIAQAYGQRVIGDSIAITDKGVQILEKADEAPATTTIKAIGDVLIENISEETGGVILKPLFGKLGKLAKRAVPKKLTTGFAKLVKDVSNETVEKAVQRVGFDGIVEEIGEERIGDLLRTTFDLDAEEGYNTDQFLDAMFPDKDQFLIEAGVISIFGGASRASQVLGNKLMSKGVSKPEVDNILENMSQTEIESKVLELDGIEFGEQKQTAIDTLVKKGYNQTDVETVVSEMKLDNIKLDKIENKLSIIQNEKIERLKAGQLTVDELANARQFTGIDNITNKLDGIKKLAKAKNGKDLLVAVNEEYGELTVRDIEGLVKTANIRLPKKDKSLTQELRAMGGINKKLAEEFDIKQLMGLQDAKSSGLFRAGENGAKREDDLIEMFVELGIVKEITTEDDATAKSQQWNEVLYSLENADDIFPKGQYREDVEAVKTEAEDIINQVFGVSPKFAKEMLKDFKATKEIVSTVDKQDLEDVKLIVKDIKKEIKTAKNALKNGIVEEAKQSQEAIIDLLKELPVKDRGKFVTSVKNINTLQELQKEAPKLIFRINDAIERNFVKDVTKQINRVVKVSKSRKVSGKTVGKYDYSTNKIFNDVRAYNKMTNEEATAEYEKIVLEEDTTPENLIRIRFLSYKSAGASATPQLAMSVYNDIFKLNQLGKLTTSSDDFLKRLNKERDVIELLDVLDSKKPVKNALTSGLFKGYIKGLANWESMLNGIFNNEVKEKYSLLQHQKNALVFSQSKKDKISKEVSKSYNLKTDRQGDKQLVSNANDKFTYYEHGERRDYAIELDRNNIIGFYIYNQNPVLRERLINQFGNSQLDAMFNELTEEDKAYGDMLIDEIDTMYERANKVFVDKYGLDMPRTERYFPSKAETSTKAIDLLSNYGASSSSPSFIKERSSSSKIKMKAINPLKVAHQHIDKMSNFIYLSDTLNRVNNFVKDSDVKRTITEKYGEEVYTALSQQLAFTSLDALNSGAMKVSTLSDTLVNNWVKTKVAIKPTIMIKQMLSMTNYTANMPTTTWFNNFAKSFSKPKKTIKYMMKNSPYIKARFSTGNQQEALQQAVQSSAFSKTKDMSDFMMLSTRIGDIGAIIFGGKPYVDYLINEKGMTTEEAFKQFENETIRSQQASFSSALSNWQNSLKDQSSIMRGLFAFRNTTNQYARKAGDAIISYSNGEMSSKQLGKELFIYTFFNSLMYNVVTDLTVLSVMLNGFGGEDETIIKSLFNLNAKAIPILGDAYEYAINKIVSGKGFETKIPVLGELIDIVDKASKSHVKAEDYWKITEVLTEMLLGIPAKSIKTMGEGTKEITEGETLRGSLKLFGYSDWAIDNALKKK